MAHNMKKGPPVAGMNARRATVSIRIRDMARTDLERVGEILFEAFSAGASRYGYASRVNSVQEGIAWAWAIFRHHPREILTAEVEDRVVGICCLNMRGVHGGVGPVAVDPSFHGKGIGRQLMDALLERAGDLQSVRLFQETFNPASFSLYCSLGFRPVEKLLDLFVDMEKRMKMELCSNVHESKEQDLDEIFIYDNTRSRFDRRPDLAYYLKWGKVFVYRSHSRILGYLACLPGSQSVQLGPLVAEGEEEARDLFQHALSMYSDLTSQTRVMSRDRFLVNSLQVFGFELYCVDNLMVRGSWRPDRCIEAFGRFPEGT
jgi:ribosomal protein S18 acetylase RimI-like enzyme